MTTVDDRDPPAPLAGNSAPPAPTPASAAPTTDSRAVAATPVEEKRNLDRRVLFESLSFIGPLPPPGMFAAYDKVLPGCANRIIALTENEQLHRHGMEARGQIFGFSLGFVGIVCATVLLALDKNIAGLGVFAAAFAPIILAFLQRKAEAPKVEPPKAPQPEPEPAKK